MIYYLVKKLIPNRINFKFRVNQQHANIPLIVTVQAHLSILKL